MQNGFILPASRNVGGLSIDQIVTDFGTIGLMIHDMVSDEEILEAYRLLAKTEGVFAEPGSIASIAGLIKFKDQIKENSNIVCIQ